MRPISRRRLVILGAGGHAVSVADVAMAAGWQVVGLVAEAKAGMHMLDIPVVGGLHEVPDFESLFLAVAIGDNAVRQAAGREYVARFGESRFPSIVHPTANVSKFARIGAGTTVMAGASVGPNCDVGRFCLLNTGSSIDHDCRMANFASLAPGAVTGGAVHIGERSAISIGAAVKHGVRIGSDCVVGAMSYVNKDVSDLQVVYGVPARFVRPRRVGDPYLL